MLVCLSSQWGSVCDIPEPCMNFHIEGKVHTVVSKHVLDGVTAGFKSVESVLQTGCPILTILLYSHACYS